MAEMTYCPACPVTRLKVLIVPREHGAWGMLFVPLLTGAIVGSFTGRNFGALALLIVDALLLFWLRTPVESLLGTQPIKVQTPSERNSVLAMSAGLFIVAAGFLAALFWGGRNSVLLLIGVGAAASFGFQTILRKLSRKTRMLSQIVGSLGLSSCAAAAYCTVMGSWDRSALILWLATWFFAANQVHFVQLSIHHAKLGDWRLRINQGRWFLVGNFALILILALAWRLHWTPGYFVVVFAPAIYRGLHWFGEEVKPLNVRALGWSEMRQAVWFGVLLVLAFGVAHLAI